MSVNLDHTIVHARDAAESANFLADILGVAPPTPLFNFLTVRLDNGVTLDYLETDSGFDVQHFAFIVDEAEFDAIFGRIVDRGHPYWADPSHAEPNRINTNDGGRGVYLADPSGHNLEIITKPYGGGR